MQTLRDHRDQPKLLYPAKLSITIDGQNKIFYDRTRFNQYLAIKPLLHNVPEGKLKLATSTKTQKIDDPQQEIPKKGKTCK